MKYSLTLQPFGGCLWVSSGEWVSYGGSGPFR